MCGIYRKEVETQLHSGRSYFPQSPRRPLGTVGGATGHVRGRDSFHSISCNLGGSSLPVCLSSCLTTFPSPILSLYLSACLSLSLSTVYGSAHLFMQANLSEHVPHVFDWLAVATPQRLVVAIKPPLHRRYLLAGQRGEQGLCAGRLVLLQ